MPGTDQTDIVIHAGLIALRHRGAWRGVLLRGESGAGKSDLALRAIERGFRLVSDDRTIVWRSGGRLYGRAPDTLSGLIEARGLDVVAEPPVAFAQIALIVRDSRPSEIERILPAGHTESLMGMAVPALNLAFLEDSAPAKLRRALFHLG